MKQHPDWELYDRYIDEGITGTSVKKRKRFMKMLEDANDGKFDLIITREVSRFARNTVDTLQETRKLKRIGVEVYFTEDHIWTFDDADGELKLTIMATLAQNESRKTSQRVKAGQMISFKNGVIYGTGNILGYDKMGKEMIINEEQAKTVRFIFDSYLQGKGTMQIKYALEQNGYLTATGLKKWSTAVIDYVLQNPFYCGTIVYRKSYIPDYLEQKARKNTGQVEKVIVEGSHEPIISKEDFEKVQNIMSKRKVILKNKKEIGHKPSTNIWSKKLICKCGSSFNRSKYHNTNSNVTYCFRCYNQKNTGSLRNRKLKGLDLTDACDMPIVQEWKLYLMFNVILEQLWNDKHAIIQSANTIIENVINDEEINLEQKKEIDGYNKRILLIKDKQRKLLDTFLNEVIDENVYKIKNNEFDADIEVLEERILAIKNSKDNAMSSLENKLKNIENIMNLSLEKKHPELNDKLIDSLIEKVEVNDNSFDWYIRCSKNNINDRYLLLSIDVTKEDILKHPSIKEEYRSLILKNKIRVNIYI